MSGWTHLRLYPSEQIAVSTLSSQTVENTPDLKVFPFTYAGCTAPFQSYCCFTTSRCLWDSRLHLNALWCDSMVDQANWVDEASSCMRTWASVICLITSRGTRSTLWTRCQKESMSDGGLFSGDLEICLVVFRIRQPYLIFSTPGP